MQEVGPHEPDISSISTCVASRSFSKVARSVSGVMPVEFWFAVASVSVRAAEVAAAVGSIGLGNYWGHQ